jgi:hypothetical protein
MPLFSQATIWRFTNNISEMKKLAAGDFKDLLQVKYHLCYRLGMWENCLGQVITVTVRLSGAVTHMMPVSFTTCASVTALVAGPL